MASMRILVNIDCLFDTLLATVMAVNIDWVDTLVRNGYISRQHNTLSKFNEAIDDSAITARYLVRDLAILKLSKRTNLVNLLTTYIAQSTGGDQAHPQTLDYKLVINTYPYNLSNAELKELFTCLKEILGVETLNRVHIPIAELTPAYIKQHYHRFIIYDFNEWVMVHGPALALLKMPLVTCVIPLCYLPEMDAAQEAREVTKWTTAGFASVLDVEFVTLADMSVCIPAGYVFDE